MSRTVYRHKLSQKLTVTVEYMFPEGMVVSYTGPDGIQLRGALLPCHKFDTPHNILDRLSQKPSLYEQSRSVLPPYASNSVISHDHTYKGTHTTTTTNHVITGQGYITDVTNYNTTSSTGVQTRQIRTVPILPASDTSHRQATVLCERPLLPKTTITNYRKAKAVTESRLQKYKINQKRGPKTGTTVTKSKPAQTMNNKQQTLPKHRMTSARTVTKSKPVQEVNNKRILPRHQSSSIDEVKPEDKRMKFKQMSLKLTKVSLSSILPSSTTTVARDSNSMNDNTCTDEKQSNKEQIVISDTMVNNDISHTTAADNSDEIIYIPFETTDTVMSLPSESETHSDNTHCNDEIEIRLVMNTPEVIDNSSTIELIPVPESYIYEEKTSQVTISEYDTLEIEPPLIISSSAGYMKEKGPIINIAVMNNHHNDMETEITTCHNHIEPPLLVVNSNNKEKEFIVSSTENHLNEVECFSNNEPQCNNSTAGGGIISGVQINYSNELEINSVDLT